MSPPWWADRQSRHFGLVHEPANMPERVLDVECLFHVVGDENRKPRFGIVSELVGGVVEISKEGVSLFLREFRWPSWASFVVWSFHDRLLRKPIEPIVDSLPRNAVSFGESRLRIALLVGNCCQDPLSGSSFIDF